MNINIDEWGIKVSNRILKLSGPKIITSYKELNNLIAECDPVSKQIIIDAFDMIEKKNRMVFIESFDPGLDEKNLIKDNSNDGNSNDETKEEDFSTTSGPVVHTFESNDDVSKNVQDDIKEETDGDIKTTENSLSDKSETVILEDYDTVNVTQTVSQSFSTIVNNENLSDNVVIDRQNGDYVADPSQKMGTLLSKLQVISKDGPVFVDEERIVDKNLNVANSISLGKIITKPLVTRSEIIYVDTRKCTILEMGKNFYKTFTKICSNLNKTVSRFSIRDGLNVAKDSVSKVGTFLAEMPKMLSSKISDGSKKIKEASLKVNNAVLNRKGELLEQLKGLRNSFSEEYNNNLTDENDVVRSL